MRWQVLERMGALFMQAVRRTGAAVPRMPQAEARMFRAGARPAADRILHLRHRRLLLITRGIQAGRHGSLA